jgi:hypothetical protein
VATEAAYIRAEGHRWTLGTATVERVVALEEGRLLLKSLKNKRTERDLVSPVALSDEFFVRIGDAKDPVTGSAGPWKLVRASQTRLKQGEVAIGPGAAAARFAAGHQKHTWSIPARASSREWATFGNAGDRAAHDLVEPGISQ